MLSFLYRSSTAWIASVVSIFDNASVALPRTSELSDSNAAISAGTAAGGRSVPNVSIALARAFAPIVSFAAT